MGKVARVALQGVHRRLFSGLPLFFLVLTTMSGSPALAADDSVACRSPIARVVSIQGTMEVSRSGSAAAWSKVSRLDTTLCTGDRVRTGPQSRAALFVQPETLVRIDQSTTIVIGANPDEPVFEFIQDEVIPVVAGDHACGAGYFVTRFPKKFRVRTPHFDAAVEGTEFLVALRCETTDLSVIEGKVLASSSGAMSFPSQSVVSGQTFTVGSGTPPAIKVLLKPADAVQWTLYYPPITPAGTVVPEDCGTVAPENRAACLIAQAEHSLRAGQTDEAQAYMADLLSGTPDSSDAKALLSIISLVKNDKPEALRLAKEAVDATPSSAPAWLALSYGQQADFQIEAALTSAQKSAELETNALSLARVAELQLSLGWTREAEKTAKQAVIANASESRAHMILGFVHLAQINVKEARVNFGQAIELDSTEPLSRLGLGLAIIRKGNLVEGREQIEIAVALDPTNSLFRSYVGKAYYEENSKERDQLASTQFGIAKSLDPKDPTPWFYDAILKQSLNHPIEALRDIETSIELNDNRAVYRSKLLLDGDQAARSISLAKTYRELGFDSLAATEASKSVNADPGNYSGHRFLSDAYSTLPRHEIARTSELLQSQVRQPLGLNPSQPYLAEDNFFLLRESGPAIAGFNEFNPLFTRKGISLQVDLLGGGNETWGDQLVLSGLGETYSYSLGQLAYGTKGFRENDDLTKHIVTGFLQFQASEDTSLQVEHRTSNTRFGDILLSFDPQLFSQDRHQLESTTDRLGLHHAFTRGSDLVISLMTIDASQLVASPGGFLVDLSTQGSLVEAQYLFESTRFNFIAGGGYYTEEQKQTFLGISSTSAPYANEAYVYSNVNVFPQFAQLHLGLTSDRLIAGDDYSKTHTSYNPKVGITFTPTQTTTLRMATFRVLKRRFFSNQTLEPTQIAGFNQFYDDLNGTDSRRSAVAIDQRVTNSVSVGIEASKRDLVVPFDSTGEEYEWKEREQRAYIYYVPSDHIAISAAYTRQEFRRPLLFPGIELITSVTTDLLPLSIKVYAMGGLQFSLTSTYVEQQGSFFSSSGSPDPEPGHSRFWISDAAVSYRLPERRGLVSIEMRNIFDKHFEFQETDLFQRTLAKDRVIFGRLTFVF